MGIEKELEKRAESTRSLAVEVININETGRTYVEMLNDMNEELVKVHEQLTYLVGYTQAHIDM